MLSSNRGIKYPSNKLTGDHRAEWTSQKTAASLLAVPHLGLQTLGRVRGLSLIDVPVLRAAKE
jgi:hypothetical protein